MKRMAIDLNKSEALARKMGFRIAAPNDPIYSDGPSIILSSRTQKQSGQNAIVSLPTGSPAVARADVAAAGDVDQRMTGSDTMDDDTMSPTEVALRAALNVLRDTLESRRMPSGIGQAHSTKEVPKRRA